MHLRSHASVWICDKKIKCRQDTTSDNLFSQQDRRQVVVKFLSQITSLDFECD